MKSAVANRLAGIVSLIGIALALLASCKKPAEENQITLAVASNFAGPIDQIARAFEEKYHCKVKVSLGGSGKHFAQISNGAPYDLFLSADSERPEKLFDDGIGQQTPASYAIGQLYLWSPDPSLVDERGEILSQTDSFQHIAIANPQLAPYGRAAEQTMRQLEVLDDLAEKIVRGENINQTYQFVASGNAQLGFIAGSQARQLDGSRWPVPSQLHDPIEQQMILISSRPLAEKFYQFMLSERAQQIIQEFGYQLPPAE